MLDIMTRNRLELLQKRAVELEALTTGDFTLSGGRTTSLYFDGRLLTMDPDAARLIAKIMLTMTEDAHAETVGGPALGALAIATALSMTALNQEPYDRIPVFVVRAAAKDHGARKQIEGHLPRGTRALVVDDVCSSGGSVLRTIEAIEQAGSTVARVVVLLDRREGGAHQIRRRGYSFRSLLELTPQGKIRAVTEEQAPADIPR